MLSYKEAKIVIEQSNLPEEAKEAIFKLMKPMHELTDFVAKKLDISHEAVNVLMKFYLNEEEAVKQIKERIDSLSAVELLDDSMGLKITYEVLIEYTVKALEKVCDKFEYPKKEEVLTSLPEFIKWIMAYGIDVAAKEDSHGLTEEDVEQLKKELFGVTGDEYKN